MKTIRFLDLPDDMQVLIGQIAEDLAPDGKTGLKNFNMLDDAVFDVINIPVKSFPIRSISGKYSDDRGGSKYAWSMAGLKLPPVVVGGNSWYDGRHRVWIARKTGVKKIDAIDLIDAGLNLVDDDYMGPIKRF